jgi:pimeloyl-ACP methyl ester carboxylesterase
MPRATASPRIDRTIELRDGRHTAYCEWGDLDGRPVVLLHGAPCSRLFCPDEDATESAGVRLLTIDRPGYGRSDPQPDRTLLDWPDDFGEFADQLGLPPCPVIGWSAGGRYAMALGFHAPDRVTTLGLAASVGPIQEVPGAIDELSPEDRFHMGLLLDDRNAGLAAIRAACDWMAGDGWEAMFRETWGEADDAVLADPVTLEAMKEMIRESARQGTLGFVADEADALSPWGFSVAEIRQPAHVWCGGSDPQVRQPHADYLAISIPRATLVAYPGEGHLIPISHWAEMLAAVI